MFMFKAKPERLCGLSFIIALKGESPDEQHKTALTLPIIGVRWGNLGLRGNLGLFAFSLLKRS